MTRKQTRKAISISGKTYQQVQAHCKEQGVSISGFIEMLVTEFFQKPMKKAVQGEEPVERPFVPNGLKKEELPVASKEPVRGGGVHSL